MKGNFNILDRSRELLLEIGWQHLVVSYDGEVITVTGTDASGKDAEVTGKTPGEVLANAGSVS